MVTKHEKEMYANVMATLLCLDRGMERDLMNLSIETLAKMYMQYIQNAKDANNKLEKVENARKQKLASSRVKDNHRSG